MSDRDFWRDRLTFIRKTQSGIDPTTRLVTFAPVKVLEDEPCDLSQADRRVAQQTPNGTVYNTVKTPILKIRPLDPTDVPDEDDEILVNGTRYKVLSVRSNWDAGDSHYMGSRLELTTTEAT